MSPITAWDPEVYSQNARFVSQLGEPLLRLLDPRPGELILDLGCGDGALTEKIAAAGSLVIGIDSSLPQLKAARRRGLAVLAMDGQQLGFRKRFDAVFSNAALHWMKRPERVAGGLAECLVPGGRFVAELGGRGNVETIRAALHSALRKRAIDPWTVDPWYYPAPEEYAEILHRCGFTISYIELIPRPTRLPGDITDWLHIFAQPFTSAVVQDEQDRFLEEVRDAVEPALRQPDGGWHADYVRLRFKAAVRRK